MGVYIKGMKMPVTCCHCPLMGYDPDIEWDDGGIETHGAYICVLTGELIDNTKREEHCPLIEIPPHGRLIDAEPIMKYITDGLNSADLGYDAIKVMTEIEYAPTIIPAEEDET